MHKMLFILEDFEPFLSSFGSWAVPEPYKNGWIIPLGFEKELDNRGISYTIIDFAEEREAIVEDLIQSAEYFGLGIFIKTFFFDNRNAIRDYEINGGDDLYKLFLNDEATELDITNDEGISPRMYALALLE